MARVRARKHKKHTEIGERHAEEARDRERRREKDDRIYCLHLPEHKKPIGRGRGGEEEKREERSRAGKGERWPKETSASARKCGWKDGE